MEEADSPKNHLMARIRTWCGVQVRQENDISLIYVNDAPIARFPSDDSVEMSLCGTIKKRLVDDQPDQLDGIWIHHNNHHVIVDLRLPRGMEEAVRMMLNAYISSQSAPPNEWSLDQEFLNADQDCQQVLSIISEHRAKNEDKPASISSVPN